MSELQPFTIEDVEAAWFAYGVNQCLDVGESPEGYIQRTWPLLPDRTDEALGISPLQPRLLEQYQRGAKALARAEVVSLKVLGEVTSQHYEQLGQVDSPVWLDDPGQHQLVRRGRNLERGPRKYHLRALRLRPDPTE